MGRAELGIYAGLQQTRDDSKPRLESKNKKTSVDARWNSCFAQPLIEERPVLRGISVGQHTLGPRFGEASKDSCSSLNMPDQPDQPMLSGIMDGHGTLSRPRSVLYSPPRPMFGDDNLVMVRCAQTSMRKTSRFSIICHCPLSKPV
jgi:hypothetical protein